MSIVFLLLAACSSPSQNTAAVTTPPEVDSEPQDAAEAEADADVTVVADGGSSTDSGSAGSAANTPPSVEDYGGFPDDSPVPPRLTPHKVRSAQLRSLKNALARPLAALRKAAPGIHGVPELDGRPLGRSYNTLEARLAEGEHVFVLRNLARAHLQPAQGDFVFYARASEAQVRDREAILESFDVDRDLPDDEAAALERLASVIEAALAAAPELRAYSLQAGWADAVGSALHGVAILSPSSTEVLWIFAEDVWYCG